MKNLKEKLKKLINITIIKKNFKKLINMAYIKEKLKKFIKIELLKEKLKKFIDIDNIKKKLKKRYKLRKKYYKYLLKEYFYNYRVIYSWFFFKKPPREWYFLRGFNSKKSILNFKFHKKFFIFLLMIPVSIFFILNFWWQELPGWITYFVNFYHSPVPVVPRTSRTW
jgi:hypothetical protein